METFRELLDAGCGERHLDAVTGGCPGCGSGDLVIVEDAEHELKLFCRECNRCWGVEGDRLHHVDPVGCPGCGQEGRCFGRLRYDVPRWGLEPGLGLVGTTPERGLSWLVTACRVTAGSADSSYSSAFRH